MTRVVLPRPTDLVGFRRHATAYACSIDEPQVRGVLDRLHEEARKQTLLRQLVEFGTSFIISTTHLAAAVRDNGGGRVIGFELEPGKSPTARRNLNDAGLREYVEICEGDV
jgi:predicted O-methyltransferase YrrM